MIWDSIRGHRDIADMFRRAISRGRLAHAYLLVGPHGVGKRLFARTIAQCLFCEQYPEDELNGCGTCAACKQVQAGTHPDLLMVGCPPGKKNIPIELLSGSREHRGRDGLCHDLALRPMSATRRVALIDDAELMAEEGANALLKTLEEPPRGSIIFLMTPEIDPILPTIRSRCQPIRFSPLSEVDIAELLLEQKFVTDPAVAAEVAGVAEGSLTTAQDLLEPELRELRNVVLRHVSARDIQSYVAASAIGAALDAFGSDSTSQRRYAFWVVHFAVGQLRDMLAACDDIERADQLGTMLDRCVEAELHLRQTMPVPLCMEALFDALSRIQRDHLLARSLG